MKKGFHVFLFILFAVLMTQSAWAANISVTTTGQSVNMPSSGTTTATISSGVTSFKVYDDGGSSGNYSTNSNGTLILNAPSGYFLRISGSVTTEGLGANNIPYDYLEVYNGKLVRSDSLLAKKYSETSGTSTDLGVITSKGMSLTLHFKSDGSKEYSGLNLTVSLYPVSSLVSVTTTGQSVNMPTIGTTTATISSSVTSFKVYDDGGNSGNYGKACDGTLVLNAPSGYVLRVSGTVTTEASGSTSPYDYLEVYNGKLVRSDSLLGKKFSSTSGSTIDFGVVTSKGQSLTFRFKSDVSKEYSGLNLTVSLYPVSSLVSVTTTGQSVNMPTIGTTTATISSSVTSFKVYDDGGNSGNYGKACDGTLVLNAPSGYVLRVSGTVNTETSGYDYLEVYNGKLVRSDSLLGKKFSSTSGSAIDFGVVTSKGQSLTFRFKSDVSNEYSGLNLTVTLLPIASQISISSTGQSVNMPTLGKTTATISSSVKSFKVYDDGGKNGNYNHYSNGTLVLTAPTGYVLELSGSISIYNESYDYLNVCDGTDTSATKLLSNAHSISGKVVSSGRSMTFYFKSDGSNNAAGLDLTVTLYKLALDLADEGNGVKYVNMPMKNTATLSIPSGVTSFKVYDDGGKNGNYSNNSSGKLVLIAPANHVLQLSGNVSIYDERYDYFAVYDGANMSAAKLLDSAHTLSGKILSSGRNLTLYLKSDGSYNAAGLDLTVTVIPTVNQIVYKNANTGGSVLSSSPTSGNIDANVSYTYSYNSGYLVSDIKVTAANGDVVKASGGWYNNKTASFKMPPSNVTVTSTYTNDWSAAGGLYIDMPTTGKLTASIPTGVKSFKVYDDGGKNGNYSHNSSGTLVLTAPTGYVLELSGSMSFYNEKFDYLAVYDGVSTSATKLLDSAHALSGKIVSSGQSMTLYMHSDGSYNGAGLDLTVTLYKLALDLADEGNGVKYVNMPMKNTATLSIPSGVTSFKVYDDGGKNGNYSNNSTGKLVLTAPANHVLQLSGSLSFYNEKFDYFAVYDGASMSAANLLDSAHTLSGKILSSGRNLTLYLKSDGSYNAAGLDLTVTVIPTVNQIVYKNANTGGSVLSSSSTSGNIDATISYTYSYNSGYLVSDIKVAAANGDVVKASGGWYNNKTASFKMPPSNVTVTSTYTNDWTVAGGLYIDMPKTGKLNATIPDGVKSFKVYDDGGKNGNYSHNSSGTLVLTAPTGYVLELSGSMSFYNEKFDYLSVYDGASTSAAKLLDSAHALSGKIVSSGRSMTLYMHSDGSYNGAGLDLTVTLYKLDLELADEGNGVKYVNMPMKNTATLIIPRGVTSFKVYDDGGKSGNYSNNSTGTLVLTAPVGYTLELSGNVSIYDEKFDYFAVYDGSSRSATNLLDSAHSLSGKILSSGRNLTLYLKSDGSYNAAGLDLTVKLVDYAIAVKSVTGGTAYSNKSSAAGGDSITLTASPSKNYMLKDFVVKDASNNVVSSTKYSFVNAAFVMPSKDVTVTPSWTSTFTVAGGLYLNLLRNKKVEVDIPSGVKSFKVYDNGGKDGNYANNSNDTLVLKAPAGYRMKLSGNVKTEKDFDYLYVFDGNSTTATKLSTTSGPMTSTSASSYIGLATYSSSGEYMTLRFRSDGSNNYDGLDLTVTLEQIKYTIAKASVTGGTLYGKDQDTLGAEVYLTGSPSNSYRMSDMKVVDKDNNVIKSPVYSFERAKFIMPASNVTATPTWTNNLTAEGGLHLDLLKNDSSDVNVPSGVKSFMLYDNGGKNGVYDNYSQDTLVLTAPKDFYLVVTGSITLERGYDSLYIFDGTKTTATALLHRSSSATGTATDIGTIASSGRSLTFRFKSDGSKNYAGLNLKISVEPVSNSITIVNKDDSYGRVSSDKTNAAMDSVVNLSWVYQTGSLIRDIDIRDASNNKIAVNGGWYSGAKASFIMPGSPVVVTPTFTNNLTADGDDGLYINMPKTGTVNATIPNRVTSFKVYDDGGASGIYSNGCDGTLVLTAPEGYVIELSGTVITEAPNSSTGYIYDYFDVYDGADKTAAKLVNKKTGNANTTVSAVHSSNRYMTLYFKTDGSGQKSGLNLVVKVIRLGIDIAKVSGGAMKSDKDFAAPGETVTLTAEAESGYLFDGVSVEDNDGNIVTLSKDIHWYSGDSENEVSFDMPANAVTVTPKFSAVNDLYVNMPRTGTVDVNMPENVLSFKVYDDGGKDGNYSHNVQGRLNIVGSNTLTGLKVSGTVAAREGDKLTLSAHMVLVGKSFYTYEGSADGEPVDIGSYSNSALLLVEFESGATDNEAGLDLKIEAIKPVSIGGSVVVAHDDAHLWTQSEKVHKVAMVTDGDKDASLDILEDVDVDSIIFAREFKTGIYTTTVFPADFVADSLTGVQKVLRFNGFKQLEDESWAVRMKRVWTTDSVGRDIQISANTPYLLVMDDATLGIRGGVTLRKTVEPIATAEDCNWKFIGTRAYHEWPDGDPLVYGFSNNQFVKAGSNVSVKPLRAYLLKPEPKQASGRPSLNGSAFTYESITPMDIPDEFDIVEDDDETGENTTVIGRYNTRTGEFRMLPSYDIKGRKLNGKPNVHKAYYGKKVIRK